MFAALAAGRLSLSAVGLLAPHLTARNADGLMKAAEHKSRSEIEELLARRFPRSELLPMVESLPGSRTSCDGHPACGAADQSEEAAENSGNQLVPERVGVSSHVTTVSCGVASPPAPVSAPPAKVVASAPDRFAVHLTIGRDTHEKLRHAQALLSHRLPSGDLASVLDLALDALVEKLEKRKFARTDTPRPRRRRTDADPRHIPAHVKRAVWERDGGCCTFVGDNGHRCDARKFLEFDHVQPVARGGQATVAGVRLRCRMHNQLEADRVFGSGFMNGMREAARREREDLRSATRRVPPA